MQSIHLHRDILDERFSWVPAWWLRRRGNQGSRGLNPTRASHLLFSGLGQPSSIAYLVSPSDGMAARH
ncbi:hypothetical protein T265_00278 [Opisthorchis viverrini]|uniref:Uncharacterized protein n=1 Tax=Opisthorchis viverrini TaxID=6198 RepID=A0A075A418_OPIVI|nr:hypothetical protein T265_00278 [Opisthorchis viverrini]KER34106.1 hypothetical protein T265_00278 [Opisthorchis viverrini]